MSRYDAEDVAREEGDSSMISNHSSSYQHQQQRHFDPPKQIQQQQRIQQEPPPPGEEPPGSSNATATSGSTANASLATAAATAAAQAAAAPTGVDSVVPDLMRVYESMIQSKTPQDTSNGSFQQTQSQIKADQDYYHRHTKQHRQQPDEQDQDPQGYAYHYQAHHQQQLDLQPYHWTYDSTSIPIPAPFHLPPQGEQHPPGPRPPSRSQQQRQPSTGRNNNARSLRRRPGPPPDYRGQGALEEAGYSSSASSRGAGGGTRSRRKPSKRGSTTNLTADDDDGDGNDDGDDFEIGDAAGSKSKKTKTDGRWSKRFTWPEDLHRDFVSAIFDVGLKHASPSTVLEHMPPHDQINTERIKSHLQKYRMHRQKSKQEFMSSYAATLQKLHKEGPPGSGTVMSGGDVAGHLTYATLTQPDLVLPAAAVAADDGATTKTQVTQPSLEPSQGQIQPQDTIVLPRLTEQEKQSPIGHSLGYLIGLFFSLKEQLDRHRRQKELAAAEAEKKFLEQQSLQHAALHDSFANDQPHQQPVVTVALSGNSNTNNYNMNPPPPPSAIASSTLPAQSSTRSNLEQSSMMKREMQSQMTFQTKLRALKQQELNKYNKLAHDMAQQQHVQQHHHHDNQQQQQQTSHPDGKPAAISDQIGSNSMQAKGLAQQQQQQQEDEYHQGTGECGTDRTALRSMSVADEEDFWNTTVVDDELFDFLMNDS